MDIRISSEIERFRPLRGGLKGLRGLMLLLVLLVASGVQAQDSMRVQHQRIMFWNVENAFWPSNDTLRQDDEYTPEGSRRWTQGRLRQKLLGLTRVIVAAGEGMSPMLVGLAEVEGDSVLHYWTHSTPLRDQHYEYVVTQGPDVRGIQTALLYEPTDFRLIAWRAHRVVMPEGRRATRDVLHAAGRVVSGDTLDVVVCHLPSRRGGARQTREARDAAHRTVMHVADSVRRQRQHPNIVIMGDMNDYPSRKSAWWGSDFDNLMLPLQRQLKWHPARTGTYKFRGEWGYLDQFVVNKGAHLEMKNARTLALPFMLTDDDTQLGHRPMRSYYGYNYEGGYSDHLPILLDVDIHF